MPIWLRRITFSLIKEHYDKQNEEHEKQANTLKNKSNKEIARPNVSSPTYTTKAPRK
jgi:hypothetical protein